MRLRLRTRMRSVCVCARACAAHAVSRRRNIPQAMQLQRVISSTSRRAGVY